MTPSILLNDGSAMPQLGFGTWQIPDDVASRAVFQALQEGYRSIDTAAIYGNEEGVGEAIRLSELPRDGIFLTTKLWNPNHEKALDALDESLARLGTPWVDLYLIHWPTPKQNLYREAWRGLVEAKKQGKARSIGVSNFTREQLDEIIDDSGVVPAVNQIELHPLFPQAELRAYHKERGIVTESWSPLAQGRLTEFPAVQELARKHGKTPAQVILRWHVELGLVVIPKSVTPERIRENLEIFDFSLDEDDMKAIASLETGERLGGDPLTANYGVD